MELIPIKQGNYGFNLTFTIYQYPKEKKIVLSLSGYTITLYVWKFKETTLKFSDTCNIVGDGSAGKCTYMVKITDFDTLGHFYAELTLTKEGALEDTETFMVEVEPTAPSA